MHGAVRLRKPLRRAPAVVKQRHMHRHVLVTDLRITLNIHQGQRRADKMIFVVRRFIICYQLHRFRRPHILRQNPLSQHRNMHTVSRPNLHTRIICTPAVLLQGIIKRIRGRVKKELLFVKKKFVQQLLPARIAAAVRNHMIAFLIYAQRLKPDSSPKKTHQIHCQNTRNKQQHNPNLLLHH